MNCTITRTKLGLFVSLTLSERNIDALEDDPRPISRQTILADGTMVTMIVNIEDNETHYHSLNRDPSMRGVAGNLGRFDEDQPVVIRAPEGGEN